MTQEFEYNGHYYKVVKVENSTDHLIIRDGRQTRRVKEEIAAKSNAQKPISVTAIGLDNMQQVLYQCIGQQL
jgi:hypothetical protein